MNREEQLTADALRVAQIRFLQARGWTVNAKLRCSHPGLSILEDCCLNDALMLTQAEPLRYRGHQ